MRLWPTGALLEIAALIAAGQSPPASVPPTPEYRARNLLRDSLTSGNPEVRTQAVQALGLAALREPYMSQLEAMLADKDVGVRVATVASMVDLKNKRTIAALKKALNDDAPEVGFAAAKALWTLKDPAGRAALLSVLAGEMKTSSGFITQQKRDALRMLHTPRTTFIFAVKQGIGFAPVPGLGTGISSLQGILSDPGVSGRAATALLLGADKDPRVLQALRDALSDKDSSVRAAAVHAIALRNDPAMEKDLVPLLEDKKDAVRVRAAAGYLRLEWIKSERRSRARKQLKKQAAAP